MSCVNVTIDDVISGNCVGKDVCVTGWIPARLRKKNVMFLTDQKHMLDYYITQYPNSIDNSINRSYALVIEFGQNPLESLHVSLKDKNGDVFNDGDCVTVYGKVSEARRIEDAIVEIE